MNFDVFLQYIIFQATTALRNKGINDGAVEVIAVKDPRLYLTLGRSDRRLGNCDLLRKSFEVPTVGCDS